MAVRGTTVVWPPGSIVQLPAPKRRAGRQPSRGRVINKKPVAISDLAFELGRKAYAKMAWREGTRGKMVSYFAAARIRTAHEHAKGEAPGEEQWLLCEWPKDEKRPTKFYLSTQPASCSLKKLGPVFKFAR